MMRNTLSMAWRNIWRSPWRSSVVIIAMALGIWAGIFTIGLTQGMNTARTDSALNDYIGHGRISTETYMINGDIAAYIPQYQEVTASLEASDQVSAWAPRLITSSMIQSGSKSTAVMVMGVDPEREGLVFSSAVNVVEGHFLTDPSGDELVIGQSLADKLDVMLDDRIVLTFQDQTGNIYAGLFWVTGIYDGVSNMVEEANLYVSIGTLSEALALPSSSAHEIRYRVTDLAELDATQAKLTASMPAVVQLDGWKRINPELGMADDIMAQAMLIFITIILLAMSFGILNTMLMAILERQRELGMLMAIGMNKSRLFALIVTETLLLSLAGLPLGIALGHVSLTLTAKTGISMASVEQGMAEYGIASTIYPVTVPEYYLTIAALVFVLSFLFSLYPARKALKLNPVESMRVL